MSPARFVYDFAINAVGSPYVYGATGKPCTPKLREAQIRQYPSSEEKIIKYCNVLNGRRPSCSGCKYHGKKAYDCAQLVSKSFATIGLVLPSGASSMWRAHVWALKAPIIPQAFNRVCALFRASPPGSRYPFNHTGVCLGDGRVVDARSHAKGVILTEAAAYPWSHFAIPAGLYDAPLSLPESVIIPTTPQAAEAVEPFLQKGNRGEAVKRLQLTLLRLGIPLPKYGADGVYGRETAAAVHAFQAMAGLPRTGKVYPDTIKELIKHGFYC